MSPDALCADGPLAGQSTAISLANWNEGRFEWVTIVPVELGPDGVIPAMEDSREEHVVYRRYRVTMFGHVVTVWSVTPPVDEVLWRLLASPAALSAAG